MERLAQLTNLQDTKAQHMVDAFTQQVLNDAIAQSSRDQGNNEIGLATFESTSTTTSAGGWSLADSSNFEQNIIMSALQLIRYLHALEKRQLQMCSLLGQPRINRALQGLLPFVEYQHLAVELHPAELPLWSLLPAALRAWLLADVAAGLLLADQSGGRCVQQQYS